MGAFLSAALYVNETGTVDIAHIDASVTFVQNGTELLVNPVLKNTMRSNSGSISLDIQVEDRGLNRILGQGNTTIGYVKADKTQTASVFIPMSGEVKGRY
ncbi:MAG: hypothetical protein SVM80_07795 [Halobacteriota archaeon]|nr:hypothetical protein [Halobacteriota archaeon]